MAAAKQTSSTGITWALALILGLLLAALRESFDGFLVGALLGVLLAQVLHLRHRTDRLDEQLQALRKLQGTRAAATTDSPPAAATPGIAESVESVIPVRAATPQPVVRPAVAGAAQTEAAQRSAAPAPMPSESISRPSQPSGIDRLLGEFVAWLKRGNPLARIGIVILFLGAVFLAKYAAENSLFPIELRFAAIALGAFALLIVGWRLRDKRSVYAQLLQGGGIAGLYLTVFAATRLYQLLPFGLALGLMVLIALAGAVLAVAQNALSLAVIGTAGGFLAPIMLATGGGNHVALFTYYAILNLGVFAIAWFRTWRVLNVLGFVLTFTITGLWRANAYTPDELFSADFFLILFFLMYVAVSILNCLRQPPDLKGYVSGSLVFGLPVVAFTLHATLVSKIEYALAWSAFALAAFYLLLGWSLLRTRRDSFRLLVEAFAALGVIFASLAIPLAFDTRTTAAMWAVEGAGLLWLGVRQQRKLARAFGALLQIAAGVGYLINLHRLHAALPMLNSAYLGALMLGVSGVIAAYLLHRNRERQASYEAGAEVVLALWGSAWWLGAGLQEIDHFAAHAYLGGALLYVAVTSAALTLGGMKLRWSLPQTVGLYLPAAAAIVAITSALNLSHPFIQWGESGWILLLAVQYGMLYLVDARRSAASDLGVRVLHAGAYWLIALLVAWESSWQIESHATGVWPSLPWGLAPALLLAIIGRHQPLPRWPLRRFADVYRLLGAAPLAAAVCGWVVFINLTSSGDSPWLVYVPLFNPLDVSVALCLAALGLWWTALDAQQRGRLWQMDDRGLIAGIAAIVFLWLNAALTRALHYVWGTPLTLHGIMTSTFIQSALSIFWGILGFMAMTIAARRKWRYVWMVGGALMLVVVAKLFLIDLSSIGTIARIASFLSVGALLLVTGYLAPLPPRKTPAGDEERT